MGFKKNDSIYGADALGDPKSHFLGAKKNPGGEAPGCIRGSGGLLTLVLTPTKNERVRQMRCIYLAEHLTAWVQFYR